MTENIIISLSHVDAGYEKEAVVNDINLNIHEGEIISLLGPSGSGKTTILRALAGFDPVLQGEISIHNAVVSRKDFTLPPEKRHIGLVFQDYALFPHLNVNDNIAFGIKGKPSEGKKARVNELLSMVDLPNISHRFPHELSGGQQQRIALARALATDPLILLMDEPFSNLDVDLRRRLSNKVCSLLKTKKITGILVTHDQDEAFAVSDRVAVLKDGKIHQWDTPYNLYHQPTNRFVASFIGQGFFIKGKAINNKIIETEAGCLISHESKEWESGSSLDVLIRPDDVLLEEHYPQKATIIEKTFHGAFTIYKLSLPGGALIASLTPSHKDFPAGSKVGFKVEPDHLVAFPNK